MKLKSLALLLAITLLAACFPATSLAETFDLDYFRSNSNIYTIDVDSEREIAFIESTAATRELSFTHDYEHPSLYSSTRFDILVTDYFSSKPKAVMRLWLTYAGTKAMNFNSASFIFCGKKYTFSGISDKEWRETDEEGTVERLLIKFGFGDTLDFLSAINNNINIEELAFVEPVTLVLHGSEDVTVEIGNYFVSDFIAMMLGLLNSNFSFGDCVSPSTIKITDYAQ